MQDSEHDLLTRALGKALLFVFVMFVSGLLLWAAIDLILHDHVGAGSLLLLGSALFWWPLFKLGRYHSRRR